MDEVPVQFFQSIISIELAVTGALLWNVRYFDRRDTQEQRGRPRSAWVLVFMSLVLAATVFGSLYAIRHRGQSAAAIAVTVGVAISVIPILLKVLPPLRRSADDGRPPERSVTIVGLVLYFVSVASIVVALSD